MDITTRRFKKEDAKQVSELIIRNYIEINSKDYGLAFMQKASEMMIPDALVKRASFSHMYVFFEEDKLVGTGSIAEFFDKKDEAIILTVFVLPEYHNRGIGKMIMKTLEKDEFFVKAKRIEIPSSITAVEFYRKLGYDYKNRVMKLDEEHHYRLEKFREIS